MRKIWNQRGVIANGLLVTIVLVLIALCAIIFIIMNVDFNTKG